MTTPKEDLILRALGYRRDTAGLNEAQVDHLLCQLFLEHFAASGERIAELKHENEALREELAALRQAIHPPAAVDR